MAFQISIGDVLMLSKLARDILQAFTSGRKSAPAEFQEVQNQLSSLSHALDSLKSLSAQHPGQGDGDSGDSGSSITPILQNCCVTLEHLAKLVSKYMIIKDQAAGGSEKKRWSDEIRKNWRKVRWTREGGDLMKLQHNLGVHINSLHLTIAVLNSEMNQSMGQQMQDVHGMLGGIYAWFSSNLKDRTMSYEHSQPEIPFDLTFSLHPGDSEPSDATICDNASFNLESVHTPNIPVFKCNCQLRRTRYGDIHDEELMQIFISPMSLAVRLNGLSQSWKIWVSGKTSRLTSLTVRNIAPSKLALFESIITDLAIATAGPTIHRGTTSLMVSPSINPYTGLPVISILNMLCDTRQLYNSIENVKLTAHGHSYSTGPIEAVQLVQYRNLTGEGTWLFSETANIILTAHSDTNNISPLEDGASEFTMTIGSDTEISNGETTSNIRISRTDCLSKTSSGQENIVKGVYVEIELLSEYFARYLRRQVNNLQDGLLLFKTQQMQLDEELIFELDLGLLMVYHYHLTDASLKLVMNIMTKDYRILISNGSRSLCLSIGLLAVALQQTAGTNALYPPFDGPIWVAESGMDMSHVYQQQRTPNLTCADKHAQQLLMLTLQSVARGDHGTAYPILEGVRFNGLEG